MMSKVSHGGSRPGAGRPKGAQNRRTRLLADKLLGAGKCPAEALVRIAEQAEADGKMDLALDAWKAVLPYVHAKPKAVELDPERVIRLAREIAEARVSSKGALDGDYAGLLEGAERKLGLAN